MEEITDQSPGSSEDYGSTGDSSTEVDSTGLSPQPQCLNECETYDSCKELANRLITITAFTTKNGCPFLNYVLENEKNDIGFILTLIERAKYSIYNYFSNKSNEIKISFLNIAIQSGNIEALKKILSSIHIDFSDLQENNNDPLTLAFNTENQEILALLLEHESSNATFPAPLKQQLLKDCTDKQIDLAKILIKNGARLQNGDRHSIPSITSISNCLEQTERFFKSIIEFDLNKVKNSLEIDKVDVNSKTEDAKIATTVLEEDLLKSEENEKSKIMKLYAFLYNKGCKKGTKFKRLPLTEQATIQANLNQCAGKASDSEIYLLEQMSYYKKDLGDTLNLADNAIEKNRNILKNLYLSLIYSSENYEYTKPIIDVLIHSSEFIEIYYDFYTDNTQAIEIESTLGTKGVANFTQKKIYLAAKRPFEELTGSTIHEFTHMVCFLLWGNNGKPYSMNSVQEHEFKEICDNLHMKYQKDENSLDLIIRLVFEKYGVENYHAELIVRVPHMIAEYGKEKALELLKKQAPELLYFYKNVVLVKSEEFVKNNKSFFLHKKCLQDIDNTILIIDERLNASNLIADKYLKVSYLKLKGEILIEFKDYANALNSAKEARNLVEILLDTDVEMYAIWQQLNTQINSIEFRIDPKIRTALESDDQKIRLYAEYLLAKEDALIEKIPKIVKELITLEDFQERKIRLYSDCLYSYLNLSEPNYVDALFAVQDISNILGVDDCYKYGEIEFWKKVLSNCGVGNFKNAVKALEMIDKRGSFIFNEAELYIIIANILKTQLRDYPNAINYLLKVASVEKCDPNLKRDAKKLANICVQEAFADDKKILKPSNNISMNTNSFFSTISPTSNNNTLSSTVPTYY